MRAHSQPAADPTPLDIDVPPVLFPSQPADGHVAFPEQVRGHFAVHLQPGSTRHCSYDHPALTATPGRHTITLTPPKELLLELDRLWGVYTDRFHVAYHQSASPFLPHHNTDHQQ
ncbi:hypothetical protein [Streptomyces angustmyceticus]|uniref:hypothetical protein n=1 Tax=Streptomyces angustmyceticus TaxID=285578 RepID=UPI003D8AE368